MHVDVAGGVRQSGDDAVTPQEKIDALPAELRHPYPTPEQEAEAAAFLDWCNEHGILPSLAQFLQFQSERRGTAE